MASHIARDRNIQFCRVESRDDAIRIALMEHCMVQYRYAIDSSGQFVDAEVLANVQRSKGWQFLCLGCNLELTAKVHGERRPHFAHRPGATCSDETYLHQLGKKVFADEFNKCRMNGEPFEIVLSYPLFCRKFESELGSPCKIGKRRLKTHDLTSLFSTIAEEQRVGDFVPDLLLTDERRPNLKVFVEIAVTHFLSIKKERSSERIIEIQIDSESDLQKIYCRRLTEETCRFVNFITDAEVADSECICSDRCASAFFVWESGKCVLDKSTLGALVSKRRRFAGQILYFRLIHVGQPGGYHFSSEGHLFYEAVQQAHADGFPLKNCYLCRYQGDNYNGDSGLPVFCKYFKKACSSNDAVSCSKFWLQEASQIRNNKSESVTYR